jgi:hypothetical protein
MNNLYCQHQLLQSLLIQILIHPIKPHQLLLDAALHQTSSPLLKHQESESESDATHPIQTLLKTAS